MSTILDVAMAILAVLGWAVACLLQDDLAAQARKSEEWRRRFLCEQRAHRDTRDRLQQGVDEERRL